MQIWKAIQIISIIASTAMIIIVRSPRNLTVISTGNVKYSENYFDFKRDSFCNILPGCLRFGYPVVAGITQDLLKSLILFTNPTIKKDYYEVKDKGPRDIRPYTFFWHEYHEAESKLITDKVNNYDYLERSTNLIVDIILKLSMLAILFGSLVAVFGYSAISTLLTWLIALTLSGWWKVEWVWFKSPLQNHDFPSYMAIGLIWLLLTNNKILRYPRFFTLIIFCQSFAEFLGFVIVLSTAIYFGCLESSFKNRVRTFGTILILGGLVSATFGLITIGSIQLAYDSLVFGNGGDTIMSLAREYGTKNLGAGWTPSGTLAAIWKVSELPFSIAILSAAIASFLVKPANFTLVSKLCLASGATAFSTLLLFIPARHISGLMWEFGRQATPLLIASTIFVFCGTYLAAHKVKMNRIKIFQVFSGEKPPT